MVQALRCGQSTAVCQMPIKKSVRHNSSVSTDDPAGYGASSSTRVVAAGFEPRVNQKVSAYSEAEAIIKARISVQYYIYKVVLKNEL